MKTITFKVGKTAKYKGKKTKLLAKIPAGKRPTKAKFPTLVNTKSGIRRTATWIVKDAKGKCYWAGTRSLSI